MIGKMRTVRSEGRRSGITIPEVLVVIAVLAILFALLMPAVQSSRESARRIQCMSHLRQLGIAIQNYEASYRVYPGYDVRWSEQLLPYLEQPVLYQRLQDWHNQNISLDDVQSAAAPVYICPSDPFSQEYRGWAPSYRMNNGYWPPQNKYNGFFQVFHGRSIDKDVFAFRQTKPADITDGLSNTAALSERLVVPSLAHLVGLGEARNNPQIWFRVMRQTQIISEPDGLDTFAYRCEFEPTTPVLAYELRDNLLGSIDNSLYSHELPPNRNSCVNGDSVFRYWEAITATSLHPGGVNLLLADGAVKFTSNSIDIKVWRALGSRNGGETIGSF